MDVIEIIETMETLLTVDDLGRLCAMSPKTIYRAIQNGQLCGIRVGGLRVNPADAAQWLRERSTRERNVFTRDGGR